MDAGEANAQHFGDRLRQLREAAGMTQEALAERAGLSVKAVSALERGHRQRPYPHTVRALADALGLTDDERAALAGTVPGRESRESRDSRERASASPVAATGEPALPAAPTALIGREWELTAITGLLRDGPARMVTLTGPGGVGKTRLALEAVATLRSDFPERTRFVPLAPLSDPSLTMPAIAQALGLAETGTSSARELLAARIRGDRWLLALDNAEHVVEAAPEVAELLAACPGLSLLVTSRAPFRIRAEYEFPVRPLQTPDLSDIPLVEQVAKVSSVRLFVERARAASPSFELTQANCAAVATVCRRMDGLPLALELVAARSRALTPTELLARLDRLLPLLVGGSRDLPERQQTMRAAIEWSDQLLAPREQTLFRRLSVFSGGWTLEAAEVVTAWGEIEPEDTLDLLLALVEQSLVVAEATDDGSTRYRMLEPIRQFAASRVDEVGERETLSDRHLEWAMALAQQAASELRGPNQQQWLDRLEVEHDNLRAALARCEADPSRVDAGLRLAAWLWRFWSTRGHLAEGRRWLETALASGADIALETRAEGLNAAGNLARDHGDLTRSGELHSENLALRREMGDLRGVALSLNNLGTVLMDWGQHGQAARYIEEALELFREHAGDWEVAIALHNLGIEMGNRGEYERAVALLDEALGAWERLGETASRARSLDALGEVERKRGNYARSAECHEECLRMRKILGDTRGVAISTRNVAIARQRQGDNETAQRMFDDALALHLRIGDRRGAAFTTSAVSTMARMQGDTERAQALAWQAIEAQRKLGINVTLTECLLTLADAAVAAGDAERAARLLGASDGLREATDEALHVSDRADYERVVAAIAGALGDEAFEAARAEGAAMSLDEALGVSGGH